MIEAGARAIHRTVCKLSKYGSVTDTDEDWDDRWRKTNPAIKDRYMAESKAALEAFMSFLEGE